jgi:hypothetical protein
LFSYDTHALKARQVANIIAAMIPTSVQKNKNLVTTLDSLFSKQHVLTELKRDPSNELTSDDIVTIYDLSIKRFQKCMQAIWASFESALPLLLQAKKQKNMVFIDSTQLLHHPEEILKYITEQLSGISFTKDMVDGWKKGAGDLFRSMEHYAEGYEGLNGKTAAKNGWVGPAVTSTRLNKPHGDFIININHFPLVTHSLIKRLASDYEKKYTPLSEFTYPKNIRSTSSHQIASSEVKQKPLSIFFKPSSEDISSPKLLDQVTSSSLQDSCP